MFSFFSKKPDLSQLKELSNDEFEEAKLKARIAFVDDEEITHIKRLTQDGYNVTHYDDIDKIDDFLRKKYNVLILDIQGVGQNISPQSEGWGILKYLKQANPNLVVIMFTGAEWSITKYKDEASVADDFIGKDLEFLDFKAKLDSGIKKAFSPNYHFEIEKKKLLKDVENVNTISQIKQIIDDYGENKKTTLKEIKKITKNTSTIETVDKFLSIIENIKKLIV